MSPVSRLPSPVSRLPSPVSRGSDSLKRFYQLEQEFRVITKQISKSANVSDRAQLKEHRNAIVAEAREIVRILNVPEPNWSSPS